MNDRWKRIKLEKVCERVTVGHVGKTSSYYCNDGIKFIRTQNVGKNGLNLNDVRYITHEFHNSLKKSQLKAGDVLISRVVTDEMRCGIVPSEFEPANCANIILLRPGPDLDSQFLRYLINSSYAQQYLMDRRVGSAQQVVNTKVLKDWVIPFPSLEEQKRIVAILDEAFAGIDTAIANTEKNLANARELFESYLNSVFSQRGEGWAEKKLASLIDISHGYAFKGSDFKVSSDTSKAIVLTPGNYSEDGELVFTEKNTKRLFGKDFSSDYLLKNGDLTIVMTDLSSQMKILGKPAFVNASNILHNQRIGRIIFKNDEVTPEFIYFYLRTRSVLQHIKQTSTGTMVRHTAPKRILALDLNYPLNKTIQSEIVSVLDALAIEIKRLESIYQQKLNSLKELKQSLLQKAFAGELTSKPDKLIDEAVA